MYCNGATVLRRLVEAPWWAGALTQRGGAWWLDAVDGGALAALPLRARLAFMHGAEV